MAQSYDWWKGYRASLQLRRTAATDPTEQAKIDAEINRVDTKQGTTPAGGANGVIASNAPGSNAPGKSIDPIKLARLRAKAQANANKQAEAELNPGYQQARVNAAADTTQQQALLRQQLGARGQLNGGLMNQGATDLSGNLIKTQAGIDTGYATNLATRSAAIMDTNFNQDLALQNQNLQQQQFNESTRQYNENMQYQQIRDSITDAQQLKEFDEYVRQFGVTATLAQLNSDRGYEIDKGQLAVSQGNLALSRQNAAGGSGGDASAIYAKAVSLAQNDPRFKDGNLSDADLQELIKFYAASLVGGSYTPNITSTLMIEDGGGNWFTNFLGKLGFGSMATGADPFADIKAK